MIKRQHAFTLTELLVVVIVIGVLAAVVLPKFSKVAETRKTTEAEELMSVVRTEQEKRCSLDRDYLTAFSQLSNIVPNEETKNFRYSLTPTGMEAASKGKYGYTLKMPSYKDGRICCENAEECAKLNKDYPLCSELMAKADYQSGEECRAPSAPTEKSCGPKPSGTPSQICNKCGTQTGTYQCNTATGKYEVKWGECSKTLRECLPKYCLISTKPDASGACNICGTKTRAVTCVDGQWITGEWGACSKTISECRVEMKCATIDGSNWEECCQNAATSDSRCWNTCNMEESIMWLGAKLSSTGKEQSCNGAEVCKKVADGNTGCHNGILYYCKLISAATWACPVTGDCERNCLNGKKISE